MAIMGKPVWAVVCGAIRNEFDLFLTLSLLCEFRNRKLIDGIIVSTWKDEIEKKQNLKLKFKNMGISYIESIPPELDVKKYTLIGMMRQHIQLRQALLVLPEDIFVVKCRTDYCVDGLHLFESILKNNVDMTLGSHGVMDFGMSYRLGVHVMPVYTFGGFSDLTFLGYKNDLLSMSKLQMFLCMYDKEFNFQDYYWFVNIFHDKFPFFEHFFVNMSGIVRLEWEDLLIKYAREVKEQKKEFRLPSVLNKFYALWFVILKNCVTSADRNVIRRDCGRFSLVDVFANDERLAINKSQWFQFTNLSVIDDIVNGKLYPSAGYSELMQEIISLATKPAHKWKMEVTSDDYDNMYLFIKNDLKQNPEKWLTKKREVVFNYNKVEDESLASAFGKFSDIIEIDEEKEYFLRYLFSTGRWVGGEYKRMENIIEYIREVFPNLYVSSLGGVGRFSKYWLKKEIAAWIEEEEDPKLRETVGMGLERHPGWMYNLPYTTEKLSAVYKYAKYLERIGAKEIPRRACECILKYYHKNDLLSLSTSTFAELIHACAKAVLDERYKEIETNTDVKIMGEFFADEFNIEELNEKSARYLKNFFINRKIFKPFLNGEENAFSNILSELKRNDEEIIPTVLEVASNEYPWAEDDVRKNLDNCYQTYLLEEKTKNKLFRLENVREILSNGYGYLPFEYKYAALCNMCAYYRDVIGLRSLAKYCRNDNDLFIYSMFFVLIEYSIVKYAFVKRENEIWLHIDMMKLGEFEKRKFKFPRDDAGNIWPYGYGAAKSPFACYFSKKENTIHMSIEFCAIPCLAKEYVVQYLNKIGYLNMKAENNLNRLMVKDFEINSRYEITDSVRRGMECFLKVGADVKKAYSYAMDKLNIKSTESDFICKFRNALIKGGASISKKDMLNDNNFISLIKTLYEQHLLGKNKKSLCEICFNNRGRYMLLQTLLRIQDDKRLALFFVGNKSGLWLHYVPYMQHEKSLGMEVNVWENGQTWPGLERENDSALIAYMRHIDGDVFISVELSAKDMVKAKILAEAVGYDEKNSSESIIRLKVLRFPFKDDKDISEAVNLAVDEFCKVGEKLVAAMR